MRGVILPANYSWVNSGSLELPKLLASERAYSSSVTFVFVSVRTETGIILRGFPYGEGHKVIVLLSPDRGQIKAVAKGVRKTKSRWGGRLEPFNQVEVVLYERKGMPTVTSAQTLESFPGIRNSLTAVLNATVMSEAVDAVAQPDQPSLALFELYRTGLEALNGGTSGPGVVAAFLLKLARVIGFSPSLSSCVYCHHDQDLRFFSRSAGGAVCSACRARGALRVSARVVQLMQELAQTDLSQLATANGPDAHSALGLTRSFVEFHIERPLVSLGVSAP